MEPDGALPVEQTGLAEILRPYQRDVNRRQRIADNVPLLIDNAEQAHHLHVFFSIIPDVILSEKGCKSDDALRITTCPTSSAITPTPGAISRCISCVACGALPGRISALPSLVYTPRPMAGTPIRHTSYRYSRHAWRHCRCTTHA